MFQAHISLENTANSAHKYHKYLLLVVFLKSHGAYKIAGAPPFFDLALRLGGNFQARALSPSHRRALGGGPNTIARLQHKSSRRDPRVVEATHSLPALSFLCGVHSPQDSLHSRGARGACRVRVDALRKLRITLRNPHGWD